MNNRTQGRIRGLIGAAAALLLLFTCFSALAEGEPVRIVFSETGVETSDPKVMITGSTVTINYEGVYELSGVSSDAEIMVTTHKDTYVDLVLNNLTLSCATGPVIWGNTDLLTITMAPNSVNRLSDSEDRVVPDSSKVPKATVYASDDLTIRGSGSLAVLSLIGNAIHCKDDLTIREATLEIDSENDGLRGNDAVSVESGSITVRSRGDGIQSSNTDSGKGHVTIEGGTLDIVADKDGIQAAGVLQINGGSITIRSGLGK